MLSGFLLEHFWWGSVFLINIPAMVLLLVVGPFLLPEFTPVGRAGSTWSSCAVVVADRPADHLRHQGVGRAGLFGGRLAFIVAGVGVGVVFVIRQRRIYDPMLDLRLFTGRQFSGSIAANTIAMFALVGNAVFLTQYLQSVLGFTPSLQRCGAWLRPRWWPVLRWVPAPSAVPSTGPT